MIKFKLNGKEVESKAQEDTPLLWVLRDEFGITGTKFGCGIAQCGACTVHLDNQPTRSCVTPISAIEDSTVVTIEGLSENGDHPLQQAWEMEQVPQCGYCQSGQIMQAAALIEEAGEPTDEQINEAMAGNLCRCMAYTRIRKAIKTGAKIKMEGARNV
ncbi:MAG: (2Fe-2S)-binding protein [Emcibacteraceae bacterium]|nr:(2Fe-2S)-binding protein [Emcibacteraceae bacterium]MDG1859823.1 (2Fe-2S)-binding protein [Emcibacteraceae bacterium]